MTDPLYDSRNPNHGRTGGLRDPEPRSSAASEDELLVKAQAFIDRKYVARADDRQKSMGLAYVEAERQDLAREIVRFVRSIYP
jgi:hypothetical protein